MSESTGMEDKDPHSIVDGNCLLLGLVGLVVGFYLIGTTVLVAADGISYIRRAEQFITDTDRTIRISGVGYPFLILVVHSLFQPGSTAAMGWVYSAQGIALASRIGACLVLYGIARRWIGPRRSFMAMLALLLLPYPSRFGADIMRDWPYLLFLIAGMGGLLAGCRTKRLVWFALAGCLSGLGYLIRVEGAQVVLLGLIALGVEWFVRSTQQPRRRIVIAGFLLSAGFFVGGGWQMALQGRLLPQKMRFGEVVTKARIAPLWDTDTDTPVADQVSQGPRWNFTAFVQSPWILLKQTTECMSPHLTAVALIGLVAAWRRMRDRSSARFWIGLWGGFEILILVYLYATYGYMSRRHALPIVVALCLLIPEGLECLAGWMRGKRNAASNPAGIHRVAWILLAAGVAINLPKLATPLREDKRGYRQASQWLAEHTPEGTMVLVDDIRAGFYSDRSYRIQRIPGPISAQFEYAVLQQARGSGPPEAQEGRRAEAAYSTPMNSRSQERVVVYRMVESSPVRTQTPE